MEYMCLVYFSYRTYYLGAAVFLTLLALCPFVLSQSCDGYEASGHCYKLFRISTNWFNASEYCFKQQRGHLASLYSNTQQAYLEDYLISEGILLNEIWTSGRRPDPEIFLGNPESFWRWVGECDDECSRTGCDGGRLDMAFVIDASGSMASGNGWSLTKYFFESLLSTLDVGDDKARISIIIYSSKEEMEETKLKKKLIDAKVPNSKPQLINLVQDLIYLDGNTDTADVLKLLRTSVFRRDRGDRINAPNVAVILTDGKSTDTRLTKEEAMKTKDAGIQLFVVGVTEEVEISEIEAMSSDPQEEGQTYFLVKSFGDLAEAVTNVSRQVCTWNKMLNVVNISAISPQGCYDDKNEDGLLIEVPIIVTSPDVCVAACRNKGYLFAGVGYRPTIPDPICKCGNEFGKGGSTGECTIPCSSTPFSNTNLCGGLNKNFVYKTDGVYGMWIYEQPNNYNDLTKNNDGVQFCGAIDSLDVDVFTFVDENCTNLYSYLCELPMDYCDGSKQKESGFKYFTLPTQSPSPSAAVCVSMCVNEDQRLTWHNARRFCQDRGGDLLRLGSYTQNEELTIQVKANKPDPGEKYFWIGLYKEGHFWMDGYVTEFSWMNFADDEPQFERGDCVYMDPKENFKWKMASCSDSKYFVCDLVRPWFTRTPIPFNQRASTENSLADVSTMTTQDRVSTGALEAQEVTTDRPFIETTEQTTEYGDVISTHNWEMTSTAEIDDVTTGIIWRMTSAEDNESSVRTTLTRGLALTSRTTSNDTAPPNWDLATTNSPTGAAPNVAKSTAQDSFLSKYWWLILLLCLLFVLLLILIILLCCYKGTQTKVGPKIYDARPIANAPVYTVLGDDEPYTFYIDSSSKVDVVVGSTIHGVPEKKCWNKTITSVPVFNEFHDIHDDNYVRNGRIEVN